MWTTQGFEQQKKFFEGLARQGGLAHAYIFSGQEMIGKKMFAQDLFTMANRHARFALHDPDLFELPKKHSKEESIYPHTKRALETTDGNDTRSGVGVYIEDIRDLKKFLSLSVYQGPYKFVIIDDAHRMTDEAANALLKALEEPSPLTVFVLVTSQPEQLPQTISSRCQHIHFLPHSGKVIEQCLTKFDLTKADRELVTGLACGRLGWALTMAKPDNLKALKKAVADFNAILKQPLAARMIYAKTLYEKELYSQYVPLWLHWAYSQYRNAPLGDPRATDGHRASPKGLARILSSLLTLHHYISQPQYNHRLLLENTLINL